MAIIIIGDQHFTSEQPFYSMQKDFTEWFTNQEFNNENNYLICTGDIFDKSLPDPLAIGLANDFFMKCKFKSIYIIEGNHDYNGRKKTHAIDIVSGLAFPKNIIIRDSYKVYTIEGKKFLFMPFLYKDMKETYESIKEKDVIDSDYIIGHFCDTEFFGEIVDLSYLKGKKIMGHVHKKMKNYIGTPYITRFDEKGKDSVLFKIENNFIEEIKCPKLLDYESISYNDTISKSEIKYPIYDIYEIPSKEIALEKFKNIYIHKMYRKKMDEEDKKQSQQIVSSEKKNKTIAEFLIDFQKEKNIKEEVINKMKLVL